MSLRAYILLALFAVSFAGRSSAQGKEDFNKQLFEIQQKYQSINRDHGYIIVTMDGVKIPGEEKGVQLTAYYKNDSLKKLVSVAGKTGGTITYEYYVYNGQLIFVQSKENNFVHNEGSATYDYTKFTLGGTAKYYYDNEKLTDAIFTTGNACTNTKDKDAVQLLLNLRAYEKALKEKK
jgi:hypothetical protein